MAAQGSSPENQQFLRMSRYAGGCLAVLALVAVLANVSSPQADQFMDNHQSRRLFVPDELKHEELTTHDTLSGFDELLEQEKTYKGTDYQTDGYRNLICAQYNGIDHPNSKACCPRSCGQYCGTSSCMQGPGGNKTCCQGQMVGGWCGPNTPAPCWVNGTKLADAFSNDVCGKYEGIDHPFGRGCCKPTCGEFCGADGSKFDGAKCEDGPGGAKNCCAEKALKPCGPKQNAPCYTAPSELKYPGAHQKFLPTQQLELQADVAGGIQFLVFSVKPDLPEGLKLDPNSGTIAGAPLKMDKSVSYEVTVTNPAGKTSTKINFNSEIEKPGTLTYPVKVLKPGNKVKLVPKITGFSAPKAAPTTYSIKPALPKGLKIDEKTGIIDGAISKDQDAISKKYTITAKNSKGESTSSWDLNVVLGFEAPSAFTYTVPPSIAPGAEVTLVPSSVIPADPSTKYSVKPALLKGLKLDIDGTVLGKLDKDAKDGKHKFVVTAENKAGKKTSEFTFNIQTPITTTTIAPPGQFTYAKKCSKKAKHCPTPAFSLCEKNSLVPKVSGAKADSFAIAPALPKGLKFNEKTGEIQGKLEKNKAAGNSTFDQQFIITGRNGGGVVTTALTASMSFKKCPVAAPFPWWIVIAAILLICLIIYCMNRPAPQEEAGYAPLQQPAPIPEPTPAPPPPPPPPPPPVVVQKAPEGLPLTFETGSGETTVYATRKPLGLVFEKHLPIKITSERESHGKDLGIQVGWTLTKINFVALPTDFKEADAVLHAEVGKLPGSIPLVWGTDSGDKTVFAFKKPLGLTFEKEKIPIKITKESVGHGQDIGIEVGWVLKKINYKDVTQMATFGEVEGVLRTEIGKLPS